jgi:DNA-binding MarR family transcriptional regulator
LTSNHLDVAANRLSGRAPAGALPVVLSFMQMLWTVVHGLQRTSKRMVSTVGVTGPQRLVLRVVGLHPGVSAGALAAILRVHPSTLTGVLQRLLRQGLLARTADPTDRRRALLHLSAAGRRLNATTAGTVESAVTAALDLVPARDRAAVRRVLTRLGTNLQPGPSAGPHRRPPRRRRTSQRSATR